MNLPSLPEGLFDPAWYLRTYTDVAASGMDPLAHYQATGRAEGRAPGAWLEPHWYLEQRERGLGPPPVGDVLSDYLATGLPAGIPASRNCPTRLVAQWAASATGASSGQAGLIADVSASIAAGGWAAGGPPQALDDLLSDPEPARDLLPESLFDYAELGLVGVIPGVVRHDQAQERGPRLLLDCGAMETLSGPVTGVERVLTSLIMPAACGWPGPVFPVGCRDGSYEHRLDLVPHLGGPELPDVGERGVSIRPGDWLLGIDVKFDHPLWPQALSAALAAGARYCHVVHDLLPVQFPEFFPPWVVAGFTGFLSAVAAGASLIMCDSQATEAAYQQWVARSNTPTLPGQQVSWFPLGSDLPAFAPPDAGTVQQQRQRVLAVGTIEPRKAYEVLLDAAQALWAAGVDAEFRIVGRRGWALPEVLERLASLAESDSPLTWLSDATDEQLQAEYAAADLLVAPSRGEGFGLPIVEAIRAGVPVLARDLPVFRELLGPDGSYFELDRDLPGRIRDCLADPAPAQALPGRLVSWQECAEALMGQLLAAAQASGARPGC